MSNAGASLAARRADAVVAAGERHDAVGMRDRVRRLGRPDQGDEDDEAGAPENEEQEQGA
jgi:alkanesulfonate monooxygenase SsuD/methylene tetrahydromethanopterin reductase-like flavin-dependent oxidoreductase (luciferase family)